MNLHDDERETTVSLMKAALSGRGMAVLPVSSGAMLEKWPDKDGADDHGRGEGPGGKGGKSAFDPKAPGAVNTAVTSGKAAKELSSKARLSSEHKQAQQAHEDAAEKFSALSTSPGNLAASVHSAIAAEHKAAAAQQSQLAMTARRFGR